MIVGGSCVLGIIGLSSFLVLVGRESGDFFLTMEPWPISLTGLSRIWVSDKGTFGNDVTYVGCKKGKKQSCTDKLPKAYNTLRYFWGFSGFSYHFILLTIVVKKYFRVLGFLNQGKQ